MPVDSVDDRTYQLEGRSKELRDKNDKQGFSIGAFHVFTDHVMCFLDVTFALTLADLILEAGSDNKAILAFAHQLKKLDQ